jgi:hypothetical protein
MRDFMRPAAVMMIATGAILAPGFAMAAQPVSQPANQSQVLFNSDYKIMAALTAYGAMGIGALLMHARSTTPRRRGPWTR